MTQIIAPANRFVLLHTLLLGAVIGTIAFVAACALDTKAPVVDIITETHVTTDAAGRISVEIVRSGFWRRACDVHSYRRLVDEAGNTQFLGDIPLWAPEHLGRGLTRFRIDVAPYLHGRVHYRAKLEYACNRIQHNFPMVFSVPDVIFEVP